MPSSWPSPSRLLELRLVLRGGDDEDLADPGHHQRRERVVDHRLVVDRHDLLADAASDRVEPGARAAGQDDPSHERRGYPRASMRPPGSGDLARHRRGRHARADMVSVLREAGHDVVGLTRAELDVTRPPSLPGGAGRPRRRRQRCRVDRRRRRRGARGEAPSRSTRPGPPTVARGAARRRRRARAGLDRLRVRRTTRRRPTRRMRRCRRGQGLRPTKAAGEWAVRACCPDARTSCAPHGCTASTGRTSSGPWWAGGAHATPLDVVDDQRGSRRGPGTWRRVDPGAGRHGAPAGTYHATSGRVDDVVRLARAVFEELGADPDRVRPTTTRPVPPTCAATQPTCFSHDSWERAGVPVMRDWRAALGAAWPSLSAVDG